jgi:L-asparaginase II
MSNYSYLPILEATRGEAIETVHYGAFVVVDRTGKIIASHGDPETKTFLRSSAKPFQAIPFVEGNGPQQFNFSLREIAIMCASHTGTDDHYDVLKKMQTAIGMGQDALLCGVHAAIDGPTREKMQANGQEPTSNRHNCSGKHTGMLAYARMMGWPTAEYIHPEHPIQKEILKTFSEMCVVEMQAVARGIDGCSAPVFGISLRNAAYGYARLCDPQDLNAKRAAACRTITSAMTSNPDMVSGPGRFDTRLMAATKGRIVSKGGAEGYQQIGIMPNVINPGTPGIGIALKISDGDTRGRVRPAIVLEILRQLGAISADELADLAEFGPKLPVKNWRELVVGEAYPTFSIEG